MFVFKKRTQSLLEMIQDGFKLLVCSYKEIWPWAAALAVIIVFIPELMLDVLRIQQVQLHSFGVAFAFMTLVLFPLAVFCASIILHRLYVIGSDAKDPLQTSVNEVKKKFFTLLFGYLLAWFVTNLGFIMMFFPGVFIGVSLIFVLPLILFDDYSITQAFQGSWLLVMDNWWRIFAVILIPFVVMSYGVYWLSGLDILPTILKTVLVFLVVPFFYSLILNAFFDAKLRHNVPLHLRMSVSANKTKSVKSKAKVKKAAEMPKMSKKVK